MATATGVLRDNHSHRLVMFGLESRKLTDGRDTFLSHASKRKEGGSKKGKKERNEQKGNFFILFASFAFFVSL
jgi:hypothetical protein